MKKVLVTLFSLACTLAAFAADASVGGSWMVESDIAGNASTATLVLAQDGKKLTGTFSSPDGKGLPVTGTVDGNKVLWDYTTEWEGTPLTVKYSGTIDAAGAINGTVVVDPTGIEGDFAAKRAEKN